MGKTAMREAVKKYVKTTTLHGFKYLHSAYYIDRVGWLICCAVSAFCAGVLCAVLWARFLEVPALLTLSDNVSNDDFSEENIPAVILCPTTEHVADLFLEKLSPNKTEEQRIPTILARLLTGKSIAKDQLSLLEDFLVDSNLNFTDLIVNYAPNCSEYTKRCRFYETVVPCERLFQPELTTSGICCKIDPKKLTNLSHHFESKSYTMQTLDLVLHYTQGSRIYGCQLSTMYDGEEDNGLDLLLPGTLNIAYQKFFVITKYSASDNLIETSCIHRKGYSRASCMLKCAEIFCGCRHPLHVPMDNDETGMLPICPVTRLDCVKGSENNMSCNCLPPCKRITTSLSLDYSKLDVQHTIDPFFMGLNETSSIVVKLRVNLAHSRIFFPIPTETWVTLLSSLGGVFNMFLGVGLFSALELLFFILVKLPAAFQKSSEINPIAEHASSVLHHQDLNRHNEYTLYPHKDRQRFDPKKQDRIVRY